MNRNIILLVLALCPFLLLGCGKEPGDHRFIHELKRENVKASPFMDEEGLKDREAVSKLRDKHLLLDAGIGENPFSIKKKITMQCRTMNVLFAPPRSRFDFSLTVPRGGVLEFGYGIMEQAWKGKGDGVTFEIFLEDGGTKRSLFQAFINPSRKFKERELFEERIDLGEYENKEVTLSFLTTEKDGFKNTLSFWNNPVLYRGGQTEKINVMIISLDTLRADHLGCYGYEKETSPNLDALARDSVLFENCYSTAPSTLIAHMSLMTSLNPVDHQVLNSTNTLDPSIKTVADYLGSSGYLCTAFTGGGLVSPVFGFSKGFDAYHTAPASAHDSAEELFTSTAQWLQGGGERAFFLFLHTYQPHCPYYNEHDHGKAFLGKKDQWKQLDLNSYLKQLARMEARQKDGKRRPAAKEEPDRQNLKFKPLPEKDRKNIINLYDGEIRYTDECFIKPLVAELKRLDLYDRTMIVVLSDHGEAFFDHGMWMHSLQLYNELIRVPLIIKLPCSRHKGTRIRENVRLIDLLPTVLREAGISGQDQPLQGRVLQPLMEGDPQEERACFAEAVAVADDSDRSLAKISVVMGDYKLIFNQSDDRDLLEAMKIPTKVEFYHLDGDPLERENLSQAQEAAVKKLLKLIPDYYRSGKGRSAGNVRVSKELEDQLRALGYLK